MSLHLVVGFLPFEIMLVRLSLAYSPEPEGESRPLSAEPRGVRAACPTHLCIFSFLTCTFFCNYGDKVTNKRAKHQIYLSISERKDSGFVA